MRGHIRKNLLFVIVLCCCSRSHAFSRSSISHSRSVIPSPRKAILTYSSRPYLAFGSIRKALKDTALLQTPPDKDELFDRRTTFAFIGGQASLIGVAAVVAYFTGTPNWGLGPGISFSLNALKQGALTCLPLGALAAALDLIEDRFPALQDVTKATQRSVLALLGGRFKPMIAFLTAIALGLAAGFGEEMLMRGVLQCELASRFGPYLGVGVSSIIFGALHAVTPLYAFLAFIASVYFGALYLLSGNLAVPIVCHALYDVGALLYAHWIVTSLPESEQIEIANWSGPDGNLW